MPKADAIKIINSRTSNRLHASAGGAIYSGDGMADTLDGFDASKQPGPSLIPVSLSDGKLDPGWLPEQAASGEGASAAGGQMYIAPWVRLARAISATDTTIYLNGNIHAVGNRAVFGHYRYGNEEIEITGGPIEQGTVYEYTITRGTTARAYPAGATVVFNLGGANDGGYITLVSGDQQQALVGPHLNMVAFDDGEEVRKVRIGRLQGLSAAEKAQFPSVEDWNVYGLYADAAFLRGQIVADSGDIAGDLDVGGTLGVWSGLGRAGVVLGRADGGHGITLQNREGRPVFGAVSPFVDEQGLLNDVAVWIESEGKKGLYYHRDAVTDDYRLEIGVETLVDGVLRAETILAGTPLESWPSTFTGVRLGAKGVQSFLSGVVQVDIDVQDGRLYFGQREGWLSELGLTLDARGKGAADELEHTIHWLNSSSLGDMVGAAIGSYERGGWFALARKRIADVSGMSDLGAQGIDDFVDASLTLDPGGVSFIESTVIEERATDRWAAVLAPNQALEFVAGRAFTPALSVAGSLLHTSDDRRTVAFGTNSIGGARIVSQADDMPVFIGRRSDGQYLSISVDRYAEAQLATSGALVLAPAPGTGGIGRVLPLSNPVGLGSQARPFYEVYAERGHFSALGSQTALTGQFFLTRRTATLRAGLEPENTVAYFAQSDLPVGDFLRFEDTNGAWEVIRINTAGVAAGDFYEYEVARAQGADVDSGLGIAAQWYAGMVGVSLGGNATDGYVRWWGLDDMNPNTGPALVTFQRDNDDLPGSVSERAAWGNLNGFYGYTTNTYGFAAGKPTASWIAVDEANGFRFFDGLTQRAIYRDYALIGNEAANNVLITDNRISLRNGQADYITLEPAGIRLDGYVEFTRTSILAMPDSEIEGSNPSSVFTIQNIGIGLFNVGVSEPYPYAAADDPIDFRLQSLSYKYGKPADIFLQATDWAGEARLTLYAAGDGTAYTMTFQGTGIDVTGAVIGNLGTAILGTDALNMDTGDSRYSTIASGKRWRRWMDA